jgi:hypothetical protein
MTAPVISIDDCGVALPAWALRLAVALVAAAVVAVLALDGLPPATLIVLALLAAATALSPASAAPAALAATAALATLLSSGGGLRPTVLALVPLVHLLHVTSAVTAVVPRGARVHMPALRRTAARFLAVQASVFALAGLAALLPHGPTPAHLEVVTVLGVAALAVMAIVLLRRR